MSPFRMNLRGIVALLSAAVVLAVVPSASATFPGYNGKIVMKTWSLAGGESTDYRVDILGSAGVSLSEPSRWTNGFQWSPSGDAILSQEPHTEGGVYTEVALRDSTGAVVKRLDLPGGAAYSPIWTRDGRVSYDERSHVAWPCGPVCTFTRSLYVADRDGKNPQRLWAYPDGPSGLFSGATGMAPAWIDSSRLVTGTDSSLSIRNSSGDVLKTIPLSGYMLSFSLSPDGRAVAVSVSLRDGSRSELRLVDLQTGKSRVVYGVDTRQGKGLNGFMWTPDGSKMIFQLREWGSGSAEQHHLYAVDADGKNPTMFYRYEPSRSAYEYDIQPCPAVCDTPIPEHLSGAGADRLEGTYGSETFDGGGGSDNITGERGEDTIIGGSGNDTIAAGPGHDKVTGGAGSDRIAAGPGKDSVSAGAGADKVNVADGARDRVTCGAGRDVVVADATDRVAKNCEKVVRP